MQALLDAWIDSSLWVASAAGALSAAASRAMGLEASPQVVALAVSGTLAVYNVDRLRDLDRDRGTAPRRSEFVARHRRGLAALAGFSAALAVGLAMRLGAATVLLLAPVLAAGLLHRRLKGIRYAKAGYISAGWLLVVVGLPALAGDGPRSVGWAAAVLGSALYANAIASNLRDREAALERLGAAGVLWIARGFAAFGVVLGLAAPGPLRPLLAVPLATLGALAPFRVDERYGLRVVDGSLLLGAVAALVFL